MPDVAVRHARVLLSGIQTTDWQVTPINLLDSRFAQRASARIAAGKATTAGITMDFIPAPE